MRTEPLDGRISASLKVVEGQQERGTTMHRELNFWRVSSRNMLAAVAGILIVLVSVAGCGTDNVTAPAAPTAPTGGSSEPLDEAVFDAYAQVGVEEFHREQLDRWQRLIDLLELTPEQVVLFQAAFDELHAALLELKDRVRDGELSYEEAYAEAQVLKAEFEAHLKTFLTSEQFDLLMELRERSAHSPGPNDNDPNQNQQGNSDERPAQEALSKWRHLAEELDLSREQVDQLVAAADELHEALLELQELIEMGALTREEAFIEAQRLRDGFELTLQTILTDEQYALLQELRMQYGPHQNGSDRIVTRWERLADFLDLTEAQLAEIIEAATTHRADLRIVWRRLAADLISAQEATALAEQLQAEFDARLRTILTEEQYALLEEIRNGAAGQPDRGHHHG